MGSISIKLALQTLTQAMHDDPDYAWGWQCNLAMAFYDTIPSSDSISDGNRHRICNEGAARFMRHAFDVDMTSRLESEFGHRPEYSNPVAESLQKKRKAPVVSHEAMSIAKKILGCTPGPSLCNPIINLTEEERRWLDSNVTISLSEKEDDPPVRRNI